MRSLVSSFAGSLVRTADARLTTVTLGAMVVLAAACAPSRGAESAPSPAASAPAAAPVPRALDTVPLSGWRSRVAEFARANLEHTAWGTAHARRNYDLALALARADDVRLDDDALFAAAYLHDMGALDAYRREGLDHQARGAEAAVEVLRGAGFPMEKAPLVQAIIGAHMYYADPGGTPEVVYFRDADTLDFLGAIGAARILSLTTRHRWAPDLAGAVTTLRRNARELPAALRTAAGRREGEARVRSLDAYLAALAAESGSAGVP